MIKSIRNTVPWTYVINDFNSNEIVAAFYEKELYKTSQAKLRVDKRIERKGNRKTVCQMKGL